MLLAASTKAQFAAVQPQEDSVVNLVNALLIYEKTRNKNNKLSKIIK